MSIEITAKSIIRGKLFFVFITMFLYSISSYCQQDYNFQLKDSVSVKSYDELIDAIYREKDSNIGLSRLYAKSYVNKGKKENDIVRIAEGFNFLAYLNKDKFRLDYFDSIIKYTQNKNLKDQPMTAYVYKAYSYYEKRNFKKALDCYLKTLYYANKNNNKNLLEETKFNIGLIKSRLGYYNEALNIFKESLKYNTNHLDNHNYLNNLYALADTYRHLKQSDSATIFNEKGLKESLAKRDTIMYQYFLLNEGVNQSQKKNYQNAINKISKSLPYIEFAKDEPNLAMGFYFLGKTYYELNENEKAKFYLKRVDTIFSRTLDLHPELRNTYELLIGYYEKEKNKEKQLYYIKKLLKTDSILNSNYKYLSLKIAKDYDTPKLIEERNLIINQLENRNKSWLYWISSLSLLALILCIALYYNYRKQKNIKVKFESYIKSQSVKTYGKSNIKQSSGLSISPEIQKSILKGLQIFETEKGYLDNSISLNSLSKKLNTNASYLSKMVNFDREKSFGRYINELRVDYAIEKLTINAVFRKYSIKAISREVGFNNSESFSNTFYQKTGLKPSYFIKQLENKTNK